MTLPTPQAQAVQIVTKWFQESSIKLKDALRLTDLKVLEYRIVDALTQREQETREPCKRAHIPDCSWCGKEQTTLGAVFYGAPNEFGHCLKHHVCRDCSVKHGLGMAVLRHEAGR